MTSVTRERNEVFRESEAVEILATAITFYQKRGDFQLLGYVIMPDHVHLLIIPQKGTISDIMRNIKAYTGNAIRRELKINSDVWQDSFYDHLIRDEKDFETRLHYMHKNPLQKGIVNDLDSYPYSSYINFYTERKSILQIVVE
ncbi:MAG TPA: transposase [Dehalococcoidia bacterium]|nr:transposase [Dehalococcoidia bacterium]